MSKNETIILINAMKNGFEAFKRCMDDALNEMSVLAGAVAEETEKKEEKKAAPPAPDHKKEKEPEEKKTGAKRGRKPKERSEEKEQQQEQEKKTEQAAKPEDNPYCGKRAIDLFKMCYSRGIDVEKHKPAKYYEDILLADDNKDEEDEEDDWDFK